MSSMLSPATGRPYGIERICRSWDLPRSSFYLQRQRALCDPPRPPRKRGPKTPFSDADLLAVIQAEVTRTAAKRSGYRRIWEHLRLDHGIRVSRKRVLRILREHQLLAPRRKAQAPQRHELSASQVEGPAPEPVPEPPHGQTFTALSGINHQKDVYPC